jgi:hypothetical protein
MTKINISIIALLLSLSSCEGKPPLKEKENNKFENKAFDSAMIVFTDKYKDVYDNDIMPSTDTIPFRYYFELERSVYVPQKRNLTFEFRRYVPITNKSYRVVYIHNDSFHFL